MELKNYQKRVMKNLSSYLDFLNQYDMKKDRRRQNLYGLLLAETDI